MISLREVKAYVATNMAGSLFSKAIMHENEEIEESEFSAKLPVWFAILKEEKDAGRKPASCPALATTAKGVKLKS
jgi:hypothetical protein